MSLKRKRRIDEIVDSRVVTFVIGNGDSKREFRVHEGALVHLSEPLRALLTGGMQESLEGKIVWDDVKPATFVLLLEYAYSGRYPIPYPDNISNAKCGSEEEGDAGAKVEQPPSLRTWVESWITVRGEKHISVFEFCKKHFCKYGVNEMTSTSRRRSLRKEALRKEGLDSKVNIALSHLLEPAELYILADRYLLDDLKELCVNDVGRKLCNAVGDGMVVDHVCSVLRFLHPQTLPQDKLRKLLLRILIGDMIFAMKNGVRKLICDFADYAVELLLEIPHSYWEELQGLVPRAPGA
ncbi:uncharacterized protein CCOS01_13307 [Colletotrichum costaricense]|uniref:BTB domain-containing protein n=1 Tax=Colletotrichum costaricense TaxID=1209916 RepID=A0AAI9YLQ5_9PEZI|nr:uncharacterized protein CCOS01_13307 [Colletotrichum costaricense]KAK1515114.1 hypothetical protein CCOS01_13307 [Colletotrichum costaricense]